MTTPWEIVSPTHHRMILNGHPLDYWPTKRKWQWKGKIHKGDVEAFVRRKAK